MLCKNLWIKLWKNMWTVQFYMFSHMFFTPFSQGVKLLRPCKQGIFHRVRTRAKPCEIPCEKTFERPCEKPVNNLWTFTVFFTIWSLCKTNRFFVAMGPFSNRSHSWTSKCAKNISDTLACGSCATSLFLPHFDVICDLLLLNRCTATLIIMESIC